jgi:hypothetical protein
MESELVPAAVLVPARVAVLVQVEVAILVAAIATMAVAVPAVPVGETLTEFSVVERLLRKLVCYPSLNLNILRKPGRIR